MEINKQLFEDVLSGKLKGVFVLRNGDKVKSSKLSIDTNPNANYPISLNRNWYTYQGEYDLLTRKNYHLDIINFIPDTNMKENELTIEIPDGKIVDWDESKKQNKLVLKDKQLTYKDVCEKLFEDKDVFYTCTNGNIDSASDSDIKNGLDDKNNATTKHQLKCILAKNQLANVAMFLNDGWRPDFNNDGWVIFHNERAHELAFTKASEYCYDSNVLFKSKKLAQQAIEILGEEIVMRAVEPLGFVKL